MSNSYDKVVEAIKDVRPVGKSIVYIGGKYYEADYNFDPPRLTEIKEEEE